MMYELIYPVNITNLYLQKLNWILNSRFEHKSLPLCLRLSKFGWLPLPPVLADTNFEYDSGFFSTNPTPNIHLHHPFPYKITRKISHKVKYLLTTLTQDENRERINIYLKISHENRKKIVFALRNLYTELHEHINVLSWL